MGTDAGRWADLMESVERLNCFHISLASIFPLEAESQVIT